MPSTNLQKINELLFEANSQLDEVKELLKTASDKEVFDLKVLKFDIYCQIKDLEAKKIKEILKENRIKPSSDSNSYTLEEIGIVLGNITRERVRQIQDQAIKKMKHPKLIKELYDYINDWFDL